MPEINTLRAVLVAGAVLAAVISLTLGLWAPAAILAVGVAAHAALWVHLGRSAAARGSLRR